jgi:methanogenic corrinoid protein MtbC1
MASKETIAAEVQELLDRLQNAIVGCHQEEAKRIAEEAVQAKLDPVMVIKRAVSGAAGVMRQKFDSGEVCTTPSNTGCAKAFRRLWKRSG